MKFVLIAFGHTASHSRCIVQLPNPSWSIALIIFITRLWRSGCPCGSRARCEIFALVNSDAAPLGHAATHAPQPMHAAASIARSESCLVTRTELASGALPVETEI